jgi:hypothetical protein
LKLDSGGDLTLTKNFDEKIEGSRLPEQSFVKLTKHLDLFGSRNVLKESYRHSQDVQALDLKLNLEVFTLEHWVDVATEDKNNSMSYFF